MTALRQTMFEDMRVRNLAPRTQITYVGCVAAFARHFGKSPDQLGPDDIRSYLLHLRDDRRLSTSTIIQAYCALRFLYRVTLGRDWTVEKLQFPKRERRLPTVLGESEVERLLRSARKLKHRVMLMTIYAGGLRVSEACTLRVNDIDSGRMVITIRQGKGRKDRYVMLSPVLLDVLRAYWKVERPVDWLFPCAAGTGPYPTRTIQLVCRQAAVDAGLSKRVTPRTLRHSFATHLLENGANIRIIQLLPGHRSLRTTADYTHVSRESICAVASPLDCIDLSPTDDQK